MGEMTRSRLWRPNLIVFVSSGCTMIVELVAGRIIAPYVGVSLYTWTSIIGVVLAGISVGNYVGGRLADRWGSLRLLGIIFLLAGLSSLGILTIERISRLTPDNLPIVAAILSLSAALFFVPSTILGMVSPVVAKLAVRDLAETGSTVGKIYASGAVGSIVGTFATGFVLISWFGTRAIVWGVALILLSLGLLFCLATRRRLLLAAILMVLGASAIALTRGWLRSTCTVETNYFCIKVEERELDGEPVRVLVLDRLVHSFSSLTDPTVLVYVYEQIYAEVTAYQSQEKENIRTLFIGGGGYTFPRYMEALYPDSELSVIEIDPGVTQVAYDQLGLRRDTSIVTYNEDARLFLEKAPTPRYDLIVGDAFNDFSVPYHLTTKEFNDGVRDWLAEDGLYMVNIIDGPRGDFVRSYVYTMRQTFGYVYLVPINRSWRQGLRTTFVVIGTDTPLDLKAFGSITAGDDVPHLSRLLLSEQELDDLLAEGRVVTLTDEYVPVDQMLAPVFRNQMADDASPD
jgi:spermidine synthase/predicted MFS family arabinose efflux permease